MLGIASGVVLATVIAASAQAEDGEKILPPPMTEEMLADPARIEIGHVIWQEQCTHCHGARAYPGKAPKLRPARYKPEFVYHRVANGFKGMPAWGELYTEDELIGIVAYVKSKEFSP